jgi:hypothetical protein
MFNNFLKRDEIISCEACKCLIEKNNAKKIKICYSLIFDEDYTIYYCPRDAPKYDRVLMLGGITKYLKDNVKVDVNGKPIKS